jgi:magnesium-transporting ATPase (P-type)
MSTHELENETTEDPSAARATAWHGMSEEQVFEQLESSPDGLSIGDIAARQEKFGRNVLPEKKPPTALEIFIRQLLSPLIYILLAAGVVALAIGDMVDAAFIFGVVLLNSSLGTFQEWRAERSAASLQSLIQPEARVKRDGEVSSVNSSNLVPGDIVLVESGDSVPADLRLVDANNLTSDEAFLTGESVASEKRTGKLEADIPVGDRSNMAFAGATVNTGRGRGVVVGTGLNTEVGQIAESVTGSATSKPPLVLRMERFAHQISYAVLGACIVVAIVAFTKGMQPLDIFFLAVALAVSAIPEGLPVAMTVALSIGTSRMAKRNVIVRKLTAVEGLGSCTFIASDKTGTLTLNRQTVTTLWLPEGGQQKLSSGNSIAEAAEQEGNKAARDTNSVDPLGGPHRNRIEKMCRLSMICSETNAKRHDGEWNFTGDAVDVAFWDFGLRLDLDPGTIIEIEKVGEIPFESERAYAAAYYRDDNATHIAVKGAPEVLLDLCHKMRGESGDIDVNAEIIRGELDALTSSGHRVMAVAYAKLPDHDGGAKLGEDDLPRLTLIGLVGLVDPPRTEVRPAVEKCLGAGIRVAMVTGDHPRTAQAIAREVGIEADETQVVTGRELADLGTDKDEAFVKRVNECIVFARVSPLQKLQIVEALIKHGHFVAVTGDGVNDAPALNRAHIGIAMGSGTDVTKGTASIIVTDDNFKSIEAGVEEGRFAYDNIRKVTYLLISTGLAEVILFIGALFGNMPIPLLPVQILWLNLVTNGIQDVALAFEGGEPGAIKRPPRKPTEGIFNRLMIDQSAASGGLMAILGFSYFYYLLEFAGKDEEIARSYLLMLMVLMQNFHVFNCRSEYVSAFRVPLSRNWLLIGGVVAAQGIHLLAINTLIGQRLLSSKPVAPEDWVILLAVASFMLIGMEIFKLIKHGRKVAWPS